MWEEQLRYLQQQVIALERTRALARTRLTQLKSQQDPSVTARYVDVAKFLDKQYGPAPEVTPHRHRPPGQFDRYVVEVQPLTTDLRQSPTRFVLTEEDYQSLRFKSPWLRLSEQQIKLKLVRYNAEWTHLAICPKCSALTTHLVKDHKTKLWRCDSCAAKPARNWRQPSDMLAGALQLPEHLNPYVQIRERVRRLRALRKQDLIAQRDIHRALKVLDDEADRQLLERESRSEEHYMALWRQAQTGCWDGVPHGVRRYFEVTGHEKQQTEIQNDEHPHADTARR
jgi:ribosomal protein L37AE/L43A